MEKFIVATISRATGNDIAVTRKPLSFEAACALRVHMTNCENGEFDYSVKEYKTATEQIDLAVGVLTESDFSDIREWLFELGEDEDLVEELTDRELILSVIRHFDGGIPAFIAMIEASQPVS